MEQLSYNNSVCSKIGGPVRRKFDVSCLPEFLNILNSGVNDVGSKKTFRKEDETKKD